jgi:regulator of sigma E protease
LTAPGPITIYEVAGEEGRKGANYFIWVMALFSINLGLINLMPVPVLDGGQLVFSA